MAVFTHGDKKYYHPTQEAARAQVMESKKAHKHVAAKARKARRVAITEARRLLKEPEPTVQERNSESPEIKALEALNDASYSLSWLMRNARSRNNKNALRNYRRKRSNVKKLHAALCARVV
jgi:hypothetical protein